MPDRVITDGTISLNSEFYKLASPVRPNLISVFPQKVTMGDHTRDDEQIASSLILSDYRGGIGIERMDPSKDIDRAWWSMCDMMQRNMLTLGRLTTDIDQPTSVSGAVLGLGSYGANLYGSWGTDIYAWNGTSWGSSVRSTTAAVRRIMTGNLSGKQYLLALTHENFEYYEGSTWARNTDWTPSRLAAFWDDKLWCVNRPGEPVSCELRFLSAINGTWTLAATLPFTDNDVVWLFTGPDALGESILYLSTSSGLWAYDAPNARVVPTGLSWPIVSTGTSSIVGRGAATWRGSIYVSHGLGVLKYTPGATATVTAVGPDRDYGVPSAYVGPITALHATINNLVAFTSTETAPDTGGTNCVGMLYDGRAWHPFWIGADSTVQQSRAHITADVAGIYRVYWGQDSDTAVIHAPITATVSNPLQQPSWDFAVSSVHETPWFDANYVNRDKLALRLRIDTEDTSSNETVVVKYATDFSASYTTLGTINSDTDPLTTTFDFPNSSTPTGTKFKTIQFQLTLNRGGTATNTPIVTSMELAYVKLLDTKYGWTVELDLHNDFKGLTPMEQQSALRTAIDSDTLVEFTFRDDSGNTRNYYCKVSSATGLERSGHDERGVWRLNLVEP